MRAATLIRLSTAGNRTDTLRTVLTAISAALATTAMLAAATVAAIRGGEPVDQPDGSNWLAPGAEHYTSPLLREPGLRLGVIFGLLLLTLPVLALAGQCIRLGAPARDRRLAAIRLAGATPGQAVLIAVAETIAASILGSAAGFGLYLAVRQALHAPGPDGRLRLPTDMFPTPMSLAVAVVAVPVLSGLIGLLLMRGVAVTPLGVVRRQRRHGPRPWPGLAIAVGIVLFNVPVWLSERMVLSSYVFGALMLLGTVLVMIGVVVGTGWISYTAGRLLHRFGRGPVTLLAGRRMMADPWNGSRTLGALLGAAVIGGAAMGYHALFVSQGRAEDQFGVLIGMPADPEHAAFYVNSARLVLVAVGVGVAVSAAGMLVALAESVVARRRTNAALTAAGTPGRALAGTLLWQTLAPLVPALGLAVVSGLVLVRSIYHEVTVGGGTTETCTDPAADLETCARTVVTDPVVTLPVPVPWEQLALLTGGTILAMTVVAGIGMLVLRSSTDLEEIRAA
ncbi:FtsX-like permease family protein [Actinoplanes philippinensis]|uniref:FtsX-like permease family protein n=1 Tax=Actinoplanes philippinensis TaxID=35752 RepID=A0A1I2JVR6_9ACTN|nr:FtsX-like permease family protein [Actinoplanes philippinensis]SFF58269.1 FtsX-like permease family protein [Actinoplanes philippinensis]